jgi:hypothetical protein
MRSYHNRYGSAKDPTLKHEFGADGIDSFYKNSVFFAFLEPWKFSSHFPIGPGTVITHHTVFSDGSGNFELRNGKDLRTFYTYEHAQEFLEEVRRRGGTDAPRDSD